MRSFPAYVLLFAALFACNPQPATPNVPAGPGTPLLSVQSADGPTRYDGPLRVAYHAPVGETTGQTEIAVAFDRPMVALGTTVDARGLIQLEPAVEGRVRWVGSQTLLFEPTRPLPMATQFHVLVPKGIRALDGTSLAEELRYELGTPALAVVSAEPWQSGERQLGERAFELMFNQPVAEAALEEHVRVDVTTAGTATQRAKVRVTRPDPNDPKQLRVSPERAWPKGAHVALTIAPALRGEEGPRPLGQKLETSFDVYGAFALARTDLCADTAGRCSPTGGVSLAFSNPVNIKSARAAVRFEPPLAALSEGDDDYQSEWVWLGRELEPLTTYKVHIDGPLKDVFGNPFTGPRVATLRTGPYEPSASFAVDGDLVQAGGKQTLPLRVRNLPRAELTLYKLGEKELEPLASGRTWVPKTKGESRTLEGAGPSERRVLDVDVSSLLAAGKGAVLAHVTRRTKRGTETIARTLLAFTDLAPSLKIGADSGLVWLTRLSTAQSVADASVRIVACGKQLTSGKTDVGGMFRFGLAKSPDCELFAIVAKDEDVSFAHQYAGVGPWELVSSADYGGQGKTAAYVFTERGIYRPGELVRIKGVLRSREHSALVPARGNVSLRLLDSQDREIERLTVALNDFGTFAHTARIPGSASLGPMSLTVEHQGQTFTESVQLAEFRRAELEAEVSTDRESYVRGETVRMRVRGKYLFGAKLASQRVFYSVNRLDRQVRPEGERYEGFVFDDETRWYDDVVPAEQTNVAGGEAKLDAEGELTLPVKLELALESGARAVELEATVEGLGGISTSARAVVSVTPAAFLVGARPKAQLVAAGKSFSVELVAATLSGEPVRGAEIEAELTRRIYTNELKAGEGGRTEYTWTLKDESVGRCKVTSQAAAVTCELTAQRPGLHFLRARSRDKQGRAVSSALPLYVFGDGEASWNPGRGPVITLKSDKARYIVGDTAKVLVASPFESAEALVTIEREGVISVEHRTLTGGAQTLDVNIDERFVPNAFVSVLLVRPASAPRPGDDGRPDFRLGSVELRTDVSDRRLKVAVKPDGELKRPGEEVRVALDVRDGKGRPIASELTVYAVDEGVLALTGYRTPDPFDSIYAPKGLAVWTSDARARLVKPTADEEDKGGEEGGGGGLGAQLRKDFESVAFYQPDVRTDERGHAEVRFRLPDSLSRFRIMAVAVSKGGELGAGDASLRTQKPLMLRAMLPRVVRVGDALLAGVVVHNEQDVDVEVELEANVTGLLRDGAAKRKVRVPKHQALEVRYAFKAERAGDAKLSFVARAGTEHDALEVTRRVLLPSALETVSTTGSTEASAAEALGALAGTRDDAGGLELVLSTSALSGLSGAADALVDYPYGCTEQLASRLVGYAARERLIKRGVLDAKSTVERARTVLTEIEKRQRPDGSFGLWAASDPTHYRALDAFLTAYALVAMDAAKAAGIGAHAPTVDSAKAFLSGYLRGERDEHAQKLGGADLAFVVLALAQQGTFDASYANKLFEEREKLPLLSKVELARAYAYGKDDAGHGAILRDEVLSQLRVTADEAHLEENLGDAHEIVMASSVRASAELVLWLVQGERTHPMLPRLVRWLSSARELDGAWSTTQETAWGLTAMSAYIEASERVSPDLTASVQVNARGLASAHLVGRKASQTVSMPMHDLPRSGGQVTVSKTGAGTLHYTMRLRYARSELPREASERGFYIEREYERIDPADLARGKVEGSASERATSGDYVRVTLHVAVPASRRFVVIYDPLPVGLEPVNFSLATESQASRAALGLDMGPLDHAELFDDRVVFAVTALEPGLYRYSYLTRASTPGKFVAPPARVEEMYHPETHGRTAARVFEVSAQ